MVAVVVNDLSKSKSSIYSLCRRFKDCVVRNPRCGLQAEAKMFFAVQWRGKHENGQVINYKALSSLSFCFGCVGSRINPTKMNFHDIDTK